MKRNYCLLLLVTVFLSACTKLSVEDYLNCANVTVRPEWGQLTTVGEPDNDFIPAGMGMKFGFYPTDGSAFLEGDGTGEMFTGSIPVGTYRVLAYNNEVAGASFTDMENYATAMVTLAENTSMSRAEGLTLVTQPSLLYASVCAEELLVPHMGAVETVAPMCQLTHSLRITFKMDKTASVSRLAGHLNGVFRSVILSTGEIPESVQREAPQVAVTFESPITDMETVVQVYFFGLLNPKNGDNYYSTLDFMLKGDDGWEQETTVNITDPVTDIIESGDGNLDMELPSDIVVKVEYTPTSLLATVESWTRGDGTGTVHGKHD